MQIPLTLMPDTDAATLFLAELSSDHSVGSASGDHSSLRLRRFEGGYFVMDRWDVSATSAPESARPVQTDSDHNSASEKHTPSDSSHRGATSDAILPFWLVLQLIESNETLRVWFHSATMVCPPQSFFFWCANSLFQSRVEKSRIFSTLRGRVRNVCDRVNQVALLQQMHAQRIVSELISPNEEEGTKAREIKVRHHVFRPGQFACPLVHRMVLPLHARLPAQRAISVLRYPSFSSSEVWLLTHMFLQRFHSRSFSGDEPNKLFRYPGKGGQCVLHEIGRFRRIAQASSS
jgi:hypothetical protein